MNFRDAQNKRQRILTAALLLFRQTHDIKKVSLESIASRAGVSPTTIYNNFGSREKLLYEVIKVLVTENLDRSRELIHENIPFAQKLTGIINGKLDMMTRVNSEIINKIVSQDKTIAPFIDEIYEAEIKPLWHEMIEDGKKQGYIDKSLNEQALLIYLDALKAGFSTRPELKQNVAGSVDLMLQLTHIMFYGFLKKHIDLVNKEGNYPHGGKIHKR